MAQVPWSVLQRQPVDAAAAAAQLRRCYRNIQKACIATEGAPAANALLQHAGLRSLKAAHAALTEVLRAEAEQPETDGAACKNACFEAIDVRGCCCSVNLVHGSCIESRSNDSNSSSSSSSKALFKAAARRRCTHAVSPRCCRYSLGTAILPPCFWQIARLGVYRHLMGFLFKFVPELDGVWLAFSETRPAAALDSSSSSKSSRVGSSRSSRRGMGLQSGAGALGFLLPDVDSNDGSVFVSLETRVLVFRPEVGSLITCKVQTVRAAVVRLLWLNTFTAVITKENLAGRFVYDEETKEYAHRKDKSRRIAEHGFVRLHVIEAPRSHCGNRLAIRGSVLARGSGPLALTAETADADASAAADAAGAAAEGEAADGVKKRKEVARTEPLAGRGSQKRREKATAESKETHKKQHNEGHTKQQQQIQQEQEQLQQEQQQHARQQQQARQ
ncbi:hypothetical protein Emed_000738 [Eimeria media]